MDIKLAVVSQFGEGQSKATAGVGLCKARGNPNANEAKLKQPSLARALVRQAHQRLHLPILMAIMQVGREYCDVLLL